MARRPRWIKPAGAALFVVLWSSGFIGAALGTRYGSAITLLMWRFIALAGIMVVASMLLRRPRYPIKVVAMHAIIGLLSQSIYLFSMFQAIQLGVSSGTVSLIDALQPIAATALAAYVLSETPARKQWLGLIVGFAGVALVVLENIGYRPGVAIWCYAIPFVGLFSLIGATVLQRKAVPIPVFDSLTIHCAASAVFFSCVGILTSNAAPVAAGGFWFAIGWLIVLATFGGYGLYWFILRRTTVVQLSSLIYLTAPVTMIWAYLMFGDPIGWLSVAGSVVCLIAVMWVQSSSARHTGSQNSAKHDRAEVVDRPDWGA